MRARLLVGPILAVALLAASPARAQSAPASEEARIRHGLELRRAQRDEEALAEFRAAYDDSHSGRALAQMALAEEALGRWVAAEAHLREVLDAGADPWVAKNAARLRAALAEIQPHLGTLDVVANVAEAALWIEGERVAPLPATARVVAGPVTFDVRAPGYEPVAQTALVAPQSVTRVVVAMAPAPPAPAPPPPAAAEPAATARAVPPHAEPPIEAPGSTPSPVPVAATVPPPHHSTGEWIAFASGGVLLTGAIAATVVRQVALGTYNNDQDCHSGSEPRYVQCGGTRSTFDVANTLMIGGYVAAGVSAAVGLVFALSAGPSPAKPTAIRAGCAPGLLTLQCAVTF